MKLQELNINELATINGGDNKSMLSGILEGFVNVHYTDDDGDTTSLGTNFGLGSIFNSFND